MSTQAALLPNPAAPLRLNLRRVMWLRAIAIPAPALLILLASLTYGVAIPLSPLIVIVLALLAMNAWTWWRLRRGESLSDAGFFAQLLFDSVALTGTLYYSGGAGNPFALFFLLPLTITATLLPRRYTWLMAGVTVVCYTGLMVLRRPLPQFLPGEGREIFDLHVAGMWLGFVLIALLVALFVAAMGETLRERDRKLAAARERALQDESLLALATQAAGAAHELSTPLATMAVITGELADQLGPEASPALRRQIEILETQIRRCKESLSSMTESAGAARSADRQPEAVQAFLERVAGRVRGLRPGSRLQILASASIGPSIACDRTLDQALTNLLNNAVDVSPRDVELQARWDAERLRIEVLDRGPGPQAVAADPGEPRGEGLGVGLLITRAIAAQHGGELLFAAREGGGTRAILELPLARLRVHA
jgi:two-component system sensor histidine kinase RegB